MSNDDDQKLDVTLDESPEGDAIAQAAEDDSAGQEALAAQELQNDDAPITDESATGEVSTEVNPDEGASQGAETVIDTEMLDDKKEVVEETQPSLVQEDVPVVEEEPEVVDENARDDSNDNPLARWYVVHTYSGHENKVANTLKQKVASEHLEAFILDVLVPTQDKIEIRSGKKETVKEKIFPGYILVKMVLDDNSWLAVRTTPGVTSFVGIGNKPTPVPESEVRTIVKFMVQGAAPTFKDVYMTNDTVKIIEGPFAQFIGKVDSVDKDRGKVRVLVSIFGRETPVELDFLQVQKL